MKYPTECCKSCFSCLPQVYLLYRTPSPCSFNVVEAFRLRLMKVEGVGMVKNLPSSLQCSSSLGVSISLSFYSQYLLPLGIYSSRNVLMELILKHIHRYNLRWIFFSPLTKMKLLYRRGWKKRREVKCSVTNDPHQYS